MGTRDVAEQLEAAIEHISELEAKLKRIAELHREGYITVQGVDEVVTTDPNFVEFYHLVTARTATVRALTAEYLRG